MKAIIIDNEAPIREGMVAMIQAFCPEITSIVEAVGVQDGIEKIKQENPDIVFLDVEMDDGTGMDLLEKLGSIPFQLVFTTAHQQYALDAFRFSAIDFLLKPIDPMELKEAVGRAMENIRVKDISGQLNILRESLSDISSSDRKIALRDSEAIHFVPVSDIIRCEADGGYTRFFFNKANTLLVSKSLKEFEDLLAPLGFIRSHHSHLINLKKIARFDRADGGTLIMENGDIVPISQRKRDSLLDIFNQL